MLTRVLSQYNRGRMTAVLESVHGDWNTPVYRVTYCKRHSTLEAAKRDLLTFVPPSEQERIKAEIANSKRI